MIKVNWRYLRYRVIVCCVNWMGEEYDHTVVACSNNRSTAELIVKDYQETIGDSKVTRVYIEEI